MVANEKLELEGIRFYLGLVEDSIRDIPSLLSDIHTKVIEVDWYIRKIRECLEELDKNE